MISQLIALNVLRPGAEVVSGGGSTPKRKTGETIWEQDDIVWPEKFRNELDEEAIILAVGLLVAADEI